MTTLFRRKSRSSGYARYPMATIFVVWGVSFLAAWLLFREAPGPQKEIRHEVVDQFLALPVEERLGVMITLHRMREVPVEAAYEIAGDFCRTN